MKLLPASFCTIAFQSCHSHVAVSISRTFTTYLCLFIWVLNPSIVFIISLKTFLIRKCRSVFSDGSWTIHCVHHPPQDHLNSSTIKCRSVFSDGSSTQPLCSSSASRPSYLVKQNLQHLATSKNRTFTFTYENQIRFTEHSWNKQLQKTSNAPLKMYTLIC